jgi:acyl-CoA synthetase (AMP-forming)/AMP-acid ligase II
VNIAAHLPAIAESHPDVLAVAVQGAKRASGKHTYQELTAKQLDEDSNRAAHGLTELGIGPGVKTVLMVTPGIEFFVLTFALFKAGAIPVLVDPGMGIKNLKACLAEAEPEAFVGITKAHVARKLFGWGKGSITKNVTVGARLFWRGAPYSKLLTHRADPILAETRADTMAAILFTSGSTGVPKGVVYTHGNFEAQVGMLRNEYRIEPGEKDLATFPLFALFGPALGMGAVVPDMDASKPITANPEHIIAAVEDYECTNLFASPALIEKVGRYAVDHEVKLPSIRRVISAGAPAQPPSLARFSKLLADGVSIWPSYGATESLPVSTITHGELIEDTVERTATGGGICIGKPFEELTVKIITISDEPIEDWSEDLVCDGGAVGEICVKGDIVTTEYYRRADSTALAKIRCADASFYHRMGDVGYLDETGRLWFCGRKAHRVTESGGDRFTIPCERIYDTHATVKRSALVGLGSKGEQTPVLCLELENPTADRDELVRALKELGTEFAPSRGIDHFLVHTGFPMDVRHNAKIFREQLAEWAARQMA